MKICEDSIRAAIDGGLSSIQLDAAQKNAILAQCRPSVAVVAPKKPLRRVVMVAAAFALALTLGGGVLAASPELRASLAVLGETALQQLQPVNQVSQDQGIKMEVLAAVNDGQVAAVYLTLQDTTGQGRVEPTTRLYDSSIVGAHFMGGEVVNYNADTQTALLCMTNLGNYENGTIENKKITVSTQSILGGESNVEPTDTGYTLADVMRAVPNPQTYLPTILESTYSGDLPQGYRQTLEDDTLHALKPWETGFSLPGLDWAEVKAVGFFDNALHVQIAPQGMGRFNRLNLILQRPDGSYVETADLQLGIGEHHELGGYNSYNDTVEYILVLPEGEDPADLRILYTGVTYETYVQGHWSTTFRLEEPDNILETDRQIELDGWQLQHVRLSPIAVTLLGTAQQSDYDNSVGSGGGEGELRVMMKDGTQVRVSGASSSFSNEGTRKCSVFENIIDVEQVEGVWLGSQRLI